MIYLPHRRKAFQAAGGVTRRKLVSTSAAANTGMHSTADIGPVIGASGDVTTICFWFQRNDSSANKTLWATEAGREQIYTTPGQLAARYGTASGGNVTGTVVLDTWHHACVQLGFDAFGGGNDDSRISLDNGTFGTAAHVSSDTGDLDIACVHYILGDDSGGGNTDDGYVGQIFDLCVIDGQYDPTDCNFSTAGGGEWDDLSAGAISNLVYRIDGQNSGDPGEDSSGNGNDFTVESSGVTLSDSGLPPGA